MFRRSSRSPSKKGTAKNLAAVKPIQSNVPSISSNGSSTHPQDPSSTKEAFCYEDMLQMNAPPPTQITVESRKQFNHLGEAAVNHNTSSSYTQPSGQTKETFDFTSHMKSVRPSFNRFGQHEPATVRIKNIITQYVGDSDGCGIEELIKELMQNSDDAGATEIHFILDKRHLPTSRVWQEWKSMQGPALCVQNNSVFTENDIESIQKLGVGSKSTDPDKTGQFGIGFNVVYQLTDCPILLSDHKDVCLFDPHLKYVPGACDDRPGGHVDLRQDGNFAKLFPDFMAGFLRGQVEHSGCTVFRFPLRQPDTKSQICDMTFGKGDIQAIEAVLQSVDFRMFLHSALIFTKKLNQVKVSIIEDDGKLQSKVVVRRLIALNKEQQLHNAQKRLTGEIKQLLMQQIHPSEVTKFSLSYNLQTEDDYLKNDWFINQTFGFHGSLSEKDLNFLRSFYGEESKRFLPVAGVACKLNSTNILVAHAYSFLPLPIQTGLPAHINGHFAIHSSRRSIWEHTSFGQWNKVLTNHVLAPAYGHFLLDLGKTYRNATDIKSWIKYLPEADRTKDEFFLRLVHRLYSYIVEIDLPVIPVPQANQLTFNSPSACLFSTAVRVESVENLLLRLDQKICTSAEVGLRFKMAKVDSLNFLNSTVLLNRLKSLNLELPKPVNRTAMNSASNVYDVLKFILEGPAAKDFSLLDGVPLCLTSDNVIKVFQSESPVFIDSEYRALSPLHSFLYIHPSISSLFKTQISKTNSKATPIKHLMFEDLALVLSKTEKYMDRSWATLFWKFVKDRSSRSEVTFMLAPCRHLPVVPVSSGKQIKLEEADKVLSTAEASKSIERVIEQIDLLRLDSKQLVDSEITEKELNQFVTPFMLNAALPSAFLTAIHLRSKSKPINLKVEHAEALLQYLSLDTQYIVTSTEVQDTVKSLPIFEDVDGVYKSINSRQGVILDSCIPTHGVTQWMERSNCLLLKEKVAYNSLYEAVGLVKKNAVEVYLDDIFPNFSHFDENLRMSHLTSLRTAVMPLLEAYADIDTQERFWSRLRTLPCIAPINGAELLPINTFRDPECEVLNLLPEYHSLPFAFADDVWLEFLRKAGLKQKVDENEILKCADAVSHLTTAEFSEEKAQLVLEAACAGDFPDSILAELCKIRFIPQESIPVDDNLLELCPPVEPLSQYISLENGIVYENDKDRHIFRHSILCWSTQKTLPRWILVSDKLTELAGIKQLPTVTEVCEHLKNLAKSLPDKISSSAFKSFRKVVSYCLDYLQNPCKCMKKRCDDCAELRSLKNVPFICVKTRHLRVKPTQVVLHLPSDIDGDVLYPYIYSRPTDMAKYDELLRYIGAHQTPSADMYAEILHSLWLEFGSTQSLHTNDKQSASLAVYGLFTSLQQGQRLTASPLCLPSDKAMMYLSTELVIGDNESLVKTLRDRGYTYMCSLSSCNLTKPAKELIFYLPETLRPKLISQLIHEEIIVDTPCDLFIDCPFYNQYCARIQSEKFRQAIWLIAKVGEERRTQFSHDLGRLKLVEIICFHVLYGHLSEAGRTLENTQTEKVVYVENSVATSKLYIQHCEEYPGHPGLVNEVSAAIRSIICYNENYYIDTGALAQLIKCQHDEDIDQYLIEQGLNTKEDDMSRPKPGTLISEEARAMFIYDPDVVFQPKEYVGYLSKSQEENMIYARILRESERTEGQDMKSLLRDYDIDIGKGYPVQANATDLFKESRRNNLDMSQQVVLSDNQGPIKTATKHHNAIIEEAKRTVTKLLDEVYADPTLWRQREKIKKMLLLKWHPDKSGNSALATEVFKHLRIEIERVELKYKLADDEEEEAEEEVIYEWEETNKQAEDKKDKKASDKELSVPKKVDMAGAYRWLRQSDLDFQTAKHLSDSNTGLEWACHICCEVIRKTMVASLLARSELTFELESTRFTNKLYEALSKVPELPGDLPVLLHQLNKLQVDETSTRQLGAHDQNKIPSEVFTREICDQVLEITEKITSCLKPFIHDGAKIGEPEENQSADSKEKGQSQ